MFWNYLQRKTNLEKGSKESAFKYVLEYLYGAWLWKLQSNGQYIEGYVDMDSEMRPHTAGGEVTPRKTERCILLLSDIWSQSREGYVSVNRSLALNLTRFKGVKVVCALMCPVEQLPLVDKEDAEWNHVVLVGPDPKTLPDPAQGLSAVYTKFNATPLELYPNLTQLLPSVTHIVGHSPVTAEAALRMRGQAYPDSKVILFNHIIPQDIEWLHHVLPYVVPTDTELVHQAEEADVVFSVTQRLHWFYSAKFRNRATTEVNHKLFIPQTSAEIFTNIKTENTKNRDNKSPRIVVIAPSGDASLWQGLDIAACAVNKVALVSRRDHPTRPLPTLIIGGLIDEVMNDVQDSITPYLTCPDLKVELHAYNSPDELVEDLQGAAVVLVPSRSEPAGHMGLKALCSGIPTLMASESAVASIVHRLTSEPEFFLVPVTPSQSAVKQDASVWRDRILSVLNDEEGSRERAAQLQMALKRDEVTKETHDAFVAFCLGGIKLKHEVMGVKFLVGNDENQEIPVIRRVNDLVMDTMKQCWRLKHHPLIQNEDLFQLLPGADLPIEKLIRQVTNKIEDRNRRIVALDRKTGSFIVYCPNPDALSDLWAMCDVINNKLKRELFGGEENPVLNELHLKDVTLRTIISGPEFLNYKHKLVLNTRPKTAAF